MQSIGHHNSESGFQGFTDLINPRDNVQYYFLQFKAFVNFARHVVLREDHVHPDEPRQRLYQQPLEFPDELPDFKTYSVLFYPGNKTIFRRGQTLPMMGRAELKLYFQDYERTATIRINISLHEGSRDFYYFNQLHFEEWIRTNTRHTTINQEECLFGFFWLFLTTPIGDRETGEIMQAFQQRADAAKQIIMHNAQCERNNLQWENHFRNVVLPTIVDKKHPSWQQSDVLGNRNQHALEIIFQQGLSRPMPYPWPENLMEYANPDALWW